MVEAYKLWIEKARDNIKWAEDNLKSGNYPLVCYLSQQAVELVLKGYWYYGEEIPPKTHQLIRLSEEVKDLDLDLTSFQKKLAVLSEYYLESRYPDMLNKELDNKNVASEALAFAKEIVNFIASKIGS